MFENRLNQPHKQEAKDLKAANLETVDALQASLETANDRIQWLNGQLNYVTGVKEEADPSFLVPTESFDDYKATTKLHQKMLDLEGALVALQGEYKKQEGEKQAMHETCEALSGELAMLSQEKETLLRRQDEAHWALEGTTERLDAENARLLNQYYELARSLHETQERLSTHIAGREQDKESFRRTLEESKKINSALQSKVADLETENARLLASRNVALKTNTLSIAKKDREALAETRNRPRRY